MNNERIFEYLFLLLEDPHFDIQKFIRQIIRMETKMIPRRDYQRVRNGVRW